MHHNMHHYDAVVATIILMKVVTLRKLPPQVARAIQERARKEKSSYSKAVISLLQDVTGASCDTKRRIYTDLDAFAGSWSQAETAAFNRDLKKQRKIDKELWE